MNAATGKVLARVEPNPGAHNTNYGADGRDTYLAGLRLKTHAVADTATHGIVRQVGPCSGAVRPFTVNGRQTLAYACVNELLGFEIGDLKSGQVLARVEEQGFAKGPVARHGCLSHGIGLTPDEKEVWVCDAANRRMHVFDATATRPRLVASIAVREEPGCVTFSIDGYLAYPSTGDVIDVATRQIIARLTDEHGASVQSEKMLEIDFAGSRAVRAGGQFGVGAVH